MGFTAKVMGLLITIVILCVWPLIGGNFIDKNIPATYRISQLTSEGYYFLGVCLVAFILNLIALISEDRLNSKKDVDNTKAQSQMTEKLDGISGDLKGVNEALDKGGYKYDSVKRVIIAPKIVTQTIKENSSGVQTTAPISNSIVAGRDLQISNEPTLSKEQLSADIELIRKILTENKLSTIAFTMTQESNGARIKQQYENELKRLGYNISSSKRLSFESIHGATFNVESDETGSYLTIYIGRF